MSKHKTQKGKKEKYLCPFRALFLLFIVVLEENPGISKIFCSHSTTTKSLGLDTGCSWGTCAVRDLWLELRGQTIYSPFYSSQQFQ